MAAVVWAGVGAARGLAGLTEIRERGELRWGADAEGGAPYVYPDPDNPGRLIGFEAEFARELGRCLGVHARHHQGNWDMLPTQLASGQCDVIINGIELTPENASKMALSRAYFRYGQVIVTLAGSPAWTNLTELRGRAVGVLSGSQSQRICQADPGIRDQVRIYSGNVEAFGDLKTGRLDAAVVDSPIAGYFVPRDPALKLGGPPFAPGAYAVATGSGNAALIRAINLAIEEMLADGTLETIYRRYQLWGPEQQGIQGAPEAPVAADQASIWRSRRLFLPLLLRGAFTTVWLTVCGMAAAMALGLGVALARLYGPAPARAVAAGYTEFFRGTPLLIQLYFIYYGLALNFGLRLPAEFAAVAALGLNYGANEAENYRAGILAVPIGQWEAAAALGMDRALALRRVILPQAWRIVVPPVSNDFVAMFKDSSIVSVISITELAKQYQTAANSSGDYLGMGVLTSAIYLAMSCAAAAALRRFETEPVHHP